MFMLRAIMMPITNLPRSRCMTLFHKKCSYSILQFSPPTASTKCIFLSSCHPACTKCLISGDCPPDKPHARYMSLLARKADLKTALGICGFYLAYFCTKIQMSRSPALTRRPKWKEQQSQNWPLKPLKGDYESRL